MLFYNAPLHHDQSNVSPICWNLCVHSILPAAQHQQLRCVLRRQYSQSHATHPLCVEEPARHFPSFRPPQAKGISSTASLHHAQTTAQAVSVKNAVKEINTSSYSTTHKPSKPMRKPYA